VSTLRSIIVTFPEPVAITRDEERALQDLVGAICKRYEAANPGRSMWLFGYGNLCTSMPITAEDEDAGVPLSFDDSVLHLEVSEREADDPAKRLAAAIQAEPDCFEKLRTDPELVRQQAAETVTPGKGTA
jgi:hypothetical protein